MLQPVPTNRGGWWPLVREPFSGAWQRNQEWTTDTVAAHHAVYACITRIAQDFGSLRARLMEKSKDGLWTETENTAHSPVLRTPNRFQNHIQFKEWWITCKLLHGNAYAYLERDGRQVVTAMYLLDPTRVQTLVSTDGSVFYKLKQDNISGLEEDEITVPASEIIHDRINCLFHPLVGTSPIFASGVAANMGLQIQNNSAAFFANGSNPSGILSTAVTITPEKATALSDLWNARFGKDKSGGVAVLGDGMKFDVMRMTATDSQLIEQLKWTAETVCSTFHVPPWKIGIGQQPPYTKPEIANQAYYSDCLRPPVEQWELCMDRGLGIGQGVTIDSRELGVDLDTDGLFRMDAASQIDLLVKASGGAVFTPDEARAKVDLGPLPGGDTLYRQEQEHSLEALSKRDEKPDPFGTTPQPAPQLPAPEPQKQLPAGDPNSADATRSVEAGWFVREYMEQSFHRIADGLDTQFRSLKDEIQKVVPVPEPVKELPPPKEEKEEEPDSLEMWDGWFARDSLALVREAQELQQRVVEYATQRRAEHATPSVLNVHVTVQPQPGKQTTKTIVLNNENGLPVSATITESVA